MVATVDILNSVRVGDAGYEEGQGNVGNEREGKLLGLEGNHVGFSWYTERRKVRVTGSGGALHGSQG